MDATIIVGKKRFLVSKNFKMKEGDSYIDMGDKKPHKLHNEEGFKRAVRAKKVLAPIQIIKEL